MPVSAVKCVAYVALLCLAVYFDIASCSWLHRSGHGQGYSFSASDFCVTRGGTCMASRRCDMSIEFFLGYCENNQDCCRSKQELCAEHFNGFCCESVQECLAIEDYTVNWLTCDGTRRCCLPASLRRRTGGRH
jgi:hypothetical protein